MPISVEEVEKVAALSKLSFSESEVTEFTAQLSDIIELVEQLDEVDTEGVPVTTHVVHDINVFREDKAVESGLRDELLANAPTAEKGFIKVPVILDDGEAGA